jgi:hypothetical protein
MKEMIVAFFIVLSVSSAFKWPQNGDTAASIGPALTAENQERLFQ